jgi:translocation and assembly module TamB
MTNDPLQPAITNLKLNGTITPERLKLNQLAFSLDGQPVSAAGQWPLPEDFWNALRTGDKSPGWKLPDWRQASGQLRIENAQLAALARYVPNIIAPAGKVDADLTLKPGGTIDGFLNVTNASTRPLAGLPPVRDVSATVRFNNSQAVLENGAAQLGGEPLRMSGKAAFPLDGPLTYQAHLAGTNLPLVRRLEFLLRGDVDLNLAGSSDATTALTGKVKLRHGLYLRYFSDLLWSGPARPAPQPPYFSITNRPFARWKLDVGVQGTRFLRVQTPVFACVASADGNLSGTLESPVVTGSASINSGEINFPFGVLQVVDGFVSLNGNDLRGPRLDFHASGTAYDYDVNLHVAGPADDANVQFSSTPPLNSEEILLLLTAGQIPQNEYAYSNRARAGNLAVFLSKDWLGRFTGSTGGQPRWIIKSGEHVSEQGHLTYSVEYRITRRWSIIGEYDQYDQYNANLKWRIISR